MLGTCCSQSVVRCVDDAKVKHEADQLLLAVQVLFQWNTAFSHSSLFYMWYFLYYWSFFHFYAKAGGVMLSFIQSIIRSVCEQDKLTNAVMDDDQTW